MMLALHPNWWDDWLLYHKVTFDGELRRIYINSNETQIDVKVDLYSSWKEWAQLRDNTKFLPAFRTTGGDPVGSGLYSGDIYFLINGWQIVVDHPVTMQGSIYHDDQIPVFVINGGGGVTAQVSNLAYAYSTTGGEADWSEQERAQIRGRLGIDGLQSAPTASGTLTEISDNISAVQTSLAAVGVAVSAVPGAVWDEVAVNHMTPGSTGAALNMSLANSESMTITTVSTMSMVENLWKYERNRTKIDTVTKQLIIYDVDGVTPIQIYNLRDRNGQPSVVESMERIPTM